MRIKKREVSSWISGSSIDFPRIFPVEYAPRNGGYANVYYQSSEPTLNSGSGATTTTELPPYPVTEDVLDFEFTQPFEGPELPSRGAPTNNGRPIKRAALLDDEPEEELNNGEVDIELIDPSTFEPVMSASGRVLTTKPRSKGKTVLAKKVVKAPSKQEKRVEKAALKPVQSRQKRPLF